MIAEIGRLTLDVATKTVPVGNEKRTVFNNRIAIPFGKDKAAFIEIVAWGKLAEFIAEHFGKGDELYIEGYMRNRDYPVADKTLQMPYILLENVKFTHENTRREKENIS